MSNRRYLIALAAGLVALGISQNARAATTRLWAGTNVTPGSTNDLAVAGNWSGSNKPSGTNNADFEDDGSDKTIVLGSPDITNSSTVDATQWTFNGLGWNITGDGTVQLNSSGQIKVFSSADNVTIGTNVNLNAGTSAFLTGGGSINITGAIAAAGGTNLNLGANGVGSGGQINLTGGLTNLNVRSLFLLGQETVTLGSSGTWAKNFTIGGNNTDVGNLVINASDSLGSVGAFASGWTDIIGTSGALVLNNITGGAVGEYVTPRFRAGANSAAAQIRNQAGNNTFSGTVSTEVGGVTGATNLTIESQAGTLTFNSFSQIVQNITGTNTLNLIGAGNGVIQSSLVQGTVTTIWGVTKDGGGTWTMSADQTYGGPTAVNGGKLLINGTNSGGGAFTVASTATLGGSGTIGANVSVAAGGKYAPGNSIDQQNIVGNLTDAGTFEVEYEGVTNTIDRADVSGAIDLTGGTINFVDLGAGDPLDNPSYIFATYGSLTGSLPTVTGVPAGYSVDYHFGGNNIALVAPEPASLGLAAIGLMGFVRCRRA